jgi:hypothetical protein
LSFFRDSGALAIQNMGCMAVNYGMPDFELREVLACPRVEEVLIPFTPSFNCECEQCGARIWVAYTSPIEPIRMCVACSAAHDDHTQHSH